MHSIRASRCADDDIIEAVAIHIPRSGDIPAAEIPRSTPPRRNPFLPSSEARSICATGSVASASDKPAKPPNPLPANDAAEILRREALIQSRHEGGLELTGRREGGDDVIKAVLDDPCRVPVVDHLHVVAIDRDNDKRVRAVPARRIDRIFARVSRLVDADDIPRLQGRPHVTGRASGEHRRPPVPRDVIRRRFDPGRVRHHVKHVLRTRRIVGDRLVLKVEKRRAGQVADAPDEVRATVDRPGDSNVRNGQIDDFLCRYAGINAVRSKRVSCHQNDPRIIPCPTRV